MGNLVWHKVNGIWTAAFKTKSGAIRVARKKYPQKELGEPFRWGSDWRIYVHKKKEKIK